VNLFILLTFVHVDLFFEQVMRLTFSVSFFDAFCIFPGMSSWTKNKTCLPAFDLVTYFC